MIPLTLPVVVMITVGLICLTAGVWFVTAYLRDKVTLETEQIIADQLDETINTILSNPTMNDDQKLAALIALLESTGEDGGWVEKLVPIAGILGAAWVVGEFLKSR
jgi:hypothetical protein